VSLWQVATTPNKDNYNKMKDRLNRNPQSEIDSSDLVHIPRNKIKVLCQNIRGIRDKTNELIYSTSETPPNFMYNGTSPQGT
jgi:hypothetical protein